MNRHILAHPLPQSITDKLNQFYFSVTQQNIPVHFLHTSFTVPFWLKDPLKIKSFLHTIRTINIKPFQAETRIFSVFKQQKTILHLTLAPKNLFQEIHDKITEKINSQIKLDDTLFIEAKIPTYKPHITLDYDWQLDHQVLDQLNQSGEKFSFSVDVVHLYAEKKKWLWEQID